MNTRQKIGEILVRLHVMSHFDVTRVLEARNRRSRRAKFGQTAQDMGLVTEAEILAAMAVQMDLMPGIERLTLNQILHALQTSETPN
jgi:hypothetical protein